MSPSECSACDRALARLNVPVDLREFAPGDGSAVAYCPRCLRTYPVESRGDNPTDSRGDNPTDSRGGGNAESTASPDAERPDGIPDGDGGAALLLAIGRLDSLATDRRAVQSLVEYAEAAGVDVFLAMDRLAADDSVDAHVDLSRRRRQLETMLE